MALKPTETAHFRGLVEKAVTDSNICDKFYAWTRKVAEELVDSIMDNERQMASIREEETDVDEDDLFDEIREGLIKKVVEEFQYG